MDNENKTDPVEALRCDAWFGSFAEYWEANGVKLDNMGAIQLAFCEVAEKAWNARASVPMAWKCTVGNEDFHTMDYATAKQWETDGFLVCPVLPNDPLALGRG